MSTTPFLRMLWMLIGLGVALPVAALPGGWQPADVLDAPAPPTRPALQPFAGVLSLGYRGDPVWVRLQLPDQLGEHRLLRLRPSFIDHIEVHLPGHLADDVRDIGDRAALTQRSVLAATPNLLLPESAAGQSVWLRLHSSSSLQLYAELVEPTEFRAGELRQQLLLAGYVALMAILLLWALAELMRRRDAVLVAYLPYQSLILLLAPALLGYFSLLWPQQPLLADRASSLVVMLITPAAIGFHFSLLRSLQAPRWLLAPGLLLVLAWLPAALLHLIWDAGRGLQLNALVVAALAPWFALVAACFRRPEPALPAWLLRTLYAAQAASLLWQMTPLLGWQRGAEANLYGSLIQGMLTALLVYAMLWTRARRLRLREQAALSELQEARQRVTIERAQREHSEALVSMLAHELRTPLSVVSLALARADAGQRSVRLAREAVNDMSELLGRCLDSGRVEDGSLAMRRERIPLAALVDELCNRIDQPERLRREVQVDTVHGDPQWLAVVLRNLLDNALRYSPEGSPITLSAGGDDSGFWLRIDNPLAGPAPDPARVFERYYRGPAAMARSGAGLGLYLVERLIRAMHGSVEWSADAGHASIRLWLPH